MAIMVVLMKEERRRMLTRERRRVGCLYHGVGGGVMGVEGGRSPVPTVRGRVEVRRIQRGKSGLARRNWVAGRCSVIASSQGVLGGKVRAIEIVESKMADRPPPSSPSPAFPAKKGGKM
jgi:hypothetical protein